MDELIAHLKNEGYAVWGPEHLTTYVFFTDGTRTGYAENTRFEGWKFATVHKANRDTGTGFSAASSEMALTPNGGWYRGALPRQFASFDEFRRQYWQPLVAY